jgi:ABC transporter DrrB family efflux protein
VTSIGAIRSAPAELADAGPFRLAVRDAYTATRRFLIRGLRQPDVTIGSVLFPIMFVVLFGYVFGSSISVPGGNYRSYLLSGLFAQSMLFASGWVAVAVSMDMRDGVIDRFKTLPIARSAILIGRTVSTVLLNLPSLIVMIGCGLAVGWRAHAGVGNAVLGFLLLQLFGFAIAWIGVVIGLIARSTEAAQALSGMPTFLLGFVSNVFVDPARMPTVLRVVADWNPMSTVVVAARHLFGTSQPASDVWPQAHPIIATIVMCGAVIAICAPIAVRLYTTRVR